jgi:hypothetical protein
VRRSTTLSPCKIIPCTSGASIKNPNTHTHFHILPMVFHYLGGKSLVSPVTVCVPFVFIPLQSVFHLFSSRCSLCSICFHPVAVCVPFVFIPLQSMLHLFSSRCSLCVICFHPVTVCVPFVFIPLPGRH